MEKNIFLLLFWIINIDLVYNQGYIPKYLQHMNPQLHANMGSQGVKTFTKTKSVKTSSNNFGGSINTGYGNAGFNFGYGGGGSSALHASERDTKSNSKYKGGCASAPPSPLNAGIKCSQYSGCRANCIPNYQFPNGETQLFITCENSEWQIKGTEWDTIPPCEPICLPQCQNNGICIAPNQCNCPENFSGPQCQYENKPCMNLPAMPLNAKRTCRSASCTITCMSGHKFPDGSSIANLICKNGNWVPAREDWSSIPDCAATCNPNCENGGVCLSFNVCQCPSEFRGPQCQYSSDACSSRKLLFNGGYNCSGSGDSYSCSLTCPEGVPFEFTPVPFYTCSYASGVFLPSPIPQCVFPDNMQVIHMGGDSHTTYEVYNSSGGSSSNVLNTGFVSGSYGGSHGGSYDGSHIMITDRPIFNESMLEFVPVGQYGKDETGFVTVDAKPGSCFTWGGSHFKTFDGKIFSFDSKCAHTLVRDAVDNTFSIVVQNNKDCSKYFNLCYRIIKIYLQDQEYVLKRTDEGVPVFATAKKTLPIPAQLPGIRVEMAAHYIVVSLDTIGIKLKWDAEYLVQIGVKENLWNRTAGLCGRFDGDFNNDMLTKDGSHPKSIVTLATSWQVDTLGESCNSIPTEEHVCLDTKTKGTKGTRATQFCKKILSDKRFSACRNVMDTSLLLDTCRWDFCACKDSDPTLCACNTLNVYVRECGHKGVTHLANWRDENTCPMQCTGGRVYMTCGPKEGQEVCGAAVEKPEDGKCEEGCYCPSGTVLHENQCITRDKCPCRLRGKSFAPGISVPKDCNTCTCVDGQWICTQVNCGARCSAIGDPHYITFDGKRYDFMGQCSYYLVSHENFTIEAENAACAGSISLAMNFPVSISSGLPSCTKAVTIKIKEQTIKLKQNQEIVVNGHELEKIPYQIDDILIRSASSIFVVVELPDGVEVWWDGITRVYVDVPAKFKGKTKGLCGTFNENQKDDFLTPEDDIEQSVIPFANKWKTEEKCKDIPNEIKSHPCDVNIQNKATAEGHCKKIKSPLFADCHWIVDPDPYYQDCLYDLCSCETKVSKCLCPMIAAYAQECALKGVKVDWRNEIRECGIHCPGGQKYQVCGNSCARTCYDITTRPNCKQQCVEGCNCPEGESLDEHGECIPIGQCGCQHEGMEFPAGYKEVRPASKGPELCTCVNALWSCRTALPTDADDYPKASDIKTKCSAFDNLEFTTCEPVEPMTCKNMHAYQPTSNRVCHPGCKCKTGYVLDTYTKKCVLPKDCACHHGGKSYKEGFIVQQDCNTCKCTKGKWKCTDRPCSTECSAWGDSHFKTFDGKLYDYQGQCDYVLAKGALGTDTFDVTIQNVPCGSLGVACSKSITIKVGDESITLTRGKHIPVNQIFKRMTVREKDLFVIVEAPDSGIIIHWDKGTRVYVKLDPRWKTKVKGLCGNYNDNEMDDFQTPSGGITEASARIFGDSWKLQSYCPDALEIIDTCEERPDRRVWALKKCGVLKSQTFAPCHSEVPVDTYFEKCVFDSCACDQGGDCECLCTALAAYAQECNAKGVPIKWRSQELCPIQCDENCAKYSPCVSTCPIETCENLLVQSPMNKLCKEDVCIEGCQPKLCPHDHVFLNSSLSECVPRNVCKPVCLQIDDVTYFEGDLIEEDACHTCFCSRGKKSCKGSPCTTTSIPPTEPGQLEQLAQCRPGWSDWINQDKAPFKNIGDPSLKETDLEPVPNTIIMNNMNGFGRCSPHEMVNIECRTVKDHISAKDTGLDVECSLEKGLICQSNNGGKECEDFEIRVLCGCDLIEVHETTGTTCPPGLVYDECAIECDHLCLFYSFIVKEKGMCKNNTQCQSGCVSALKKMSCPAEKRWSNDHTCVEENECICSTPTGIPVKPGTVYKPSECETCQCVDNHITCDISTCDEGYDGILQQILTEDEEDEDAVVEQFETGFYENETHTVVVSTMTPPSLCDEDMYLDLIQGDQPLPDNAFTASSTLGKLYAPHNAKFGSKLTEKSAGSWSPAKSNKKQHLDINLGRVEPIYGIVVKGSPLYTEYVTSYYVLHSTDGARFNYITGKNKKPKKFRGSVDSNTPVKQMLDVPIEAKIIRINPRTWNNGISLKVELIGCGEPMTTTTTMRPIVCTDGMGLGDAMMADQQISVSSELEPDFIKKNIIIEGPSAWQPMSNTPTEWIQFNFLEPRNITGVVTEGGPKGWVKTYKVTYSNDAKQWNPIVDESQNEKIFPGNFDKNTPQTNYFYLPIQTTYLKVVPLKWEKNIQMRIEPLGCYEPYPTLPEVLYTTPKPSACNYCPGVEPVEMELEACRCSDDKWWDGENCVTRTLCPCMVGHIPYAVGTIYEKEDCSQCICKLGGVSHCVPKVCEKCENGLKSVVTITCGCICKPCDDGTTLCPTSNICINSTLWCNGVQDCPDDEINCLTTPVPVETTTTMTEKPAKECPTPSCPPGYKVVNKKPDKKKYAYLATMFSTKTKGGSQYVPVKTVGTKGGNRKTLQKPLLPPTEEVVEEKECPQFQCISTRPPPEFQTGKEPAEPCPPVKCPPGYSPEYDSLDVAKKHECPRYECKPPQLPDSICNVTGRTFNTFDKTEYKYDICNHILARDLENDIWDVALKKTCDKSCSRDLVIHHEDHYFVLHPDLTVLYDGFKYTVDQTKKIGSQTKAFSISRLGDMLLFVSNRYGFWVMWDKQGNVKVGVTPKLLTKVDGLCGYYNDNPDDDKRKPDGTPGRTTVEFGDSWALGDQPSICETKACPMHIQNKAWDMCNQVKHESFSKCSNVIEIESFVSRCLETTCACLEAAENNQTTEDMCRCQTLTNFVTDCLTADNELELMDWRTQHDCPVECKAPLIHHDCYRRKCEPTCGTIGDSNACPKIPNVCFPGCYCPPGYVKKGETCIKAADCRDCECNVLPHLQYVTYDESNFTVNGNCVYVMSRDILNNNNQQHKFQVLITNHPCEDRPNKMCVGKVTILYQGHKVHIIRDERNNRLRMIADSEVVEDFADIRNWARVEVTGSKHFKIFLDAIQVQVNVYYPSLGTAVKSPSHKYSGKLEGLCGDCNKDPSNDLTTPKGKLIKDVDEFATSWLYEGIIGQSKESCENKPKPKCDLTVHNDPCLILRDAGRFGQCHPLLEPSMFIEWCKNDVCGAEVNQACNAISAYARECLNAGFCVQWHSDLCPAKSCPVGQLFEQCGTSCPETCESIKEEKKKCKETPTEGCFCPEGLYLMNDTCVERAHCEVCDAQGHHAGDIWKEDACTTCSCVGTSLICEAQQCPSVETVCEPGYSPVKIPARHDECCDKYVCAPAATISPTCEPPQTLNCAPGQVMKLDTKHDGCKQFICQCKPLEECEPVDLTPATEDGMIKEIDNSGCCPVEKLVCKPELCSAPADCPMYYETKNTTVSGKCCPIYTCQAPDKCIFDSEYTASENGGERLKNMYERQKLLKAANETWNDGPCRDCKCTGDKNKGFHSICSVQECPDINQIAESKEFVLKPDYIVNQCCPNIKRVACIDQGKTYEIGQKWHPKDDFCTTIECVVGKAGLQKNTQVTNCDTTCDVGWEYIPAPALSMECCGSCKQIACVVDGHVRKIGEEWSSSDFCTNYVCSNINGSLQVQAIVVNCPVISPELINEFVYETQLIDGECCKEHKIVACKVGTQEYKIGDVWPSPDGDNCKKITCVKNNLGEITKQELVETCNTNCTKGWEYIESNTTCCGECVQVACVVNDELKKPGQNWTSSDTCTTFTCEKSEDQFTVSSFHESCPNIDDCPEINIYSKGCCKHCNVTSMPLTTCLPEEMQQNKSVGIIKVSNLDHGICINKAALKGFTECVGNCHSSTYFNSKTGAHESVCSCCRATKYDSLTVELDCEDGYRLKKQIPVPSKCSCEGCSAENFTKNPTKGGVKTG